MTSALTSASVSACQRLDFRHFKNGNFFLFFCFHIKIDVDWMALRLWTSRHILSNMQTLTSLLFRKWKRARQGKGRKNWNQWHLKYNRPLHNTNKKKGLDICYVQIHWSVTIWHCEFRSQSILLWCLQKNIIPTIVFNIFPLVKIWLLLPDQSILNKCYWVWSCPNLFVVWNSELQNIVEWIPLYRSFVMFSVHTSVYDWWHA